MMHSMPDDEDLPGDIREAVERNDDRITGLLVRQIGPGHHAAIIALASVEPRRPSHDKALLAEIHRLSHVTIEVKPERADCR
jgi:Co/Zn/Cd efflux system component